MRMRRCKKREGGKGRGGEGRGHEGREGDMREGEGTRLGFLLGLSSKTRLHTQQRTHAPPYGVFCIFEKYPHVRGVEKKENE